MNPLVPRRQFLTRVSAGAAALAASPAIFAQQSPAPVANSGKNTLAEPAFRPLSLGSISPEGWLRRQLRLQADGLSGHLDEFWPDLAQSQWFGGKAEGWERAPYWPDGLIPLAWVLGDEWLQAKARRHLEYIVAKDDPGLGQRFTGSTLLDMAGGASGWRRCRW
jgi:uncharacterized protein